MKNTQSAAEAYIKKHTEFPHQPTFREVADLMVTYADAVNGRVKKGPHQVDTVNIDKEIAKHVGR